MIVGFQARKKLIQKRTIMQFLVDFQFQMLFVKLGQKNIPMMEQNVTMAATNMIKHTVKLKTFIS